MLGALLTFSKLYLAPAKNSLPHQKGGFHRDDPATSEMEVVQLVRSLTPGGCTHMVLHNDREIAKSLLK